MKILIARVAVFAVCMLFGLFVFWIGGGAFERGPGLQLTVIITSAVSLYLQMYPGWPSAER